MMDPLLLMVISCLSLHHFRFLPRIYVILNYNEGLALLDIYTYIYIYKMYKIDQNFSALINPNGFVVAE